MSDIRNLLARAQESEVKGDKVEAAGFLRKAASWYRDRQMLRRAAQMLRQARRVEGIEDEDDEADEAEPVVEDVFGFGDDFVGDAAGKVLVEQREPQLADPSVDAWCSFCCRPKAEVGALVAGPAGAYICEGCTERSRSLRGGGPAAPTVTLAALTHELPAQRRARDRWVRSRPKLALVIGPSGSGKSAWVESLAHDDLLVVDSPGDAAAVLEWIKSARRSAIVMVTGAVPPPALVLPGEHGDEPIHDTAGLATVVPAAIAARIDAVHAFESPGEAALLELARHLAQKREVELSDAYLQRFVELARKVDTGAHELVTLLSRVPPGRYG